MDADAVPSSSASVKPTLIERLVAADGRGRVALGV